MRRSPTSTLPHFDAARPRRRVTRRNNSCRTIRFPIVTLAGSVVAAAGLNDVFNSGRRIRIVDARIERLAFNIANTGCQKENSSCDFESVARIQRFDFSERTFIEPSPIPTLQVSNKPVAIVGKDLTVLPAATIAVQHDLTFSAPSDDKWRARHERMDVAP